MLFSSIPFLYYFLPSVLILYYLVPKAMKNSILWITSLIFYAWGEPAYVFLMVASILIGYLFGILIEKFQRKDQIQRNKRLSKQCMILAVGIHLGLLGYFKYSNFLIKNINAVTGCSFSFVSVALPIGISFYTFQIISYLVDVYRGEVTAQKNPIALAAYITMFPQLIAGPIVRYSDIEKELEYREITFAKIAYGIRRFLFGLGKKVIIANSLGECVNIFKESNEKTFVFYWMYAIVVSLQIYFDFSGYSDMAIGLGSMLGFHFPENFQYPFISKSITEFWRRWHISLGTWFRDYVYIPLGGSRHAKWRNLFLVWCLTGLWHGAEWTFLIWGLYFGILLMIEKRFYYQWLNRSKGIGHLYTIGLVVISFVIFDAATFPDAIESLQMLFGFGNLPFCNATTVYYVKSYFGIGSIALIGATPLPKRLVEKWKQNTNVERMFEIAEPFCMIAILLIATAYLVDGSFNPFLYFRF